jgi:hypothetical protein
MLEDLYDEFRKFSRSECHTFLSFENEGSRPFKYNKGKEGATSFDMACKQVHHIDSDGGRPPKNQEKTSDLRGKRVRECTIQEKGHRQNKGGYSNRGRGRGRNKKKSFVLYVL